MRRWTVLFAASAAEQARIVDDWWLTERPSAPDLFSDELSRAIDRLSTAPASGAPFESAVGGVRRVLLAGSRYHVYYTLDSARREVLVRAIWHASRGQGPQMS